MEELYSLAARGQLDYNALETEAKRKREEAVEKSVAYEQDRKAWVENKFTKELVLNLIIEWRKADNEGLPHIKRLVTETLEFIEKGKQ